MANYYVWSGATGAGTGASWANAYTTLEAAFSARGQGDTFFVAHDHAQTQASNLVMTSPGTEASPCRVYCTNRAGSVPPVSADLRTTATITTTGAFSITGAGAVAECYGIIFSAGDAANIANITIGNTVSRTWRLVNCALRLMNSGATSRINLVTGGGASVCILENTTMQFGALTQFAQTAARVIWRNTIGAITGATIPNVLFTFNSAIGSIFMEGLDLSAITGGKAIISVVGTGGPQIAILKDCKLGAGAVLSSTNPTVGYGNQENTMIRCDSGDTNYRTEKISYSGTMTTETSIVRSGGASDGTTPISWKIVTTVNSEWEFPFECLPISVWNETVGTPITVTVEGIWGTGAVPLNSDIWIDVEYLGTSGFPLGGIATSNKATGLTTAGNLPTGSGTWSGGSTTQFKMSATFTPQEKGPLTIYVRAAKVSSTFYVDPKPVIT